MKIFKITFLPTLLLLVFVLTGCEKNNTNANQVVNVTNTSNTNEIAVNNSNLNEIDTSDWQTYTNEEYGFNFKYPSNLEVAKNVSNSEYQISTSVRTKELDPVTKDGSTIFSISIPIDAQNIESDINSYIGANKTTTQINNKLATQYTYYLGMEENETKPHNTKSIFIKYNNQTYVIIQTYYHIQDDYDRWFLQILNSLTFF